MASKDYYDQIYDINFFSGDSYQTKVGEHEVTVSKGEMGTEFSSADRDLLEFCETLKEGIGRAIETVAIEHATIDARLQIKLLLACEEAYRKEDRKNFFMLLSKIMLATDIEDLKMKCTKLEHGWHALHALAQDLPAMEFLTEEVLSHCREEGEQYSKEDIKVEEPVRKDWIRRGIDIANEQEVQRFYQDTYSYILELTAANLQVETLFNYEIVLRMLESARVQRIYDYGGGIGTFSLLARARGMDVTFADLPSKTSEFAHKRFDSKVRTVELDPTNHEFPADVQCIVCTEVLEHIFDPDALVRKIYDALPQRGIFVVSESYDFVDEFCSHLPQHKGKGDQVFQKFLEEVGFYRCTIPGFSIHPSVHVKV